MSLFDDNNQGNTEPSMFSPAIFQKIVKGTCLSTCAINLYCIFTHRVPTRHNPITINYIHSYTSILCRSKTVRGDIGTVWKVRNLMLWSKI